jgi:hypothetical protein
MHVNVMIAWNIMAILSYLIIALLNVLSHALNLSTADLIALYPSSSYGICLLPFLGFTGMFALTPSFSSLPHMYRMQNLHKTLQAYFHLIVRLNILESWVFPGLSATDIGFDPSSTITCIFVPFLCLNPSYPISSPPF